MSAKISSGTKTTKTKNDPRLDNIIVHYNEDSSSDDAMLPIYEFMYGVLTGTIPQEQRKGA